MSKSTKKGSSGSPSNKDSGAKKTTGNTGTRSSNKGDTSKGLKK